jgi:hypothetical protein
MFDDSDPIEGGFDDISEFGTQEVVDPKAMPDVIARRLQAYRRRKKPLKQRQLERSVEHRAKIREREGLGGPPPNPLPQRQLLNVLRERLTNKFHPDQLERASPSETMAAPPNPEDLKLMDALRKQIKNLQETQALKARQRKGSARTSRRRNK